MKGHRMVSSPAVMCFFQELLTLESSSYLTCLANAPPAITSCGHHMLKHCLPHSPQEHNIGTNLTPQQCCHAKMLQSSVSNDVTTGDCPISNKSDVVSSSLGLCLFLVQQIHVFAPRAPNSPIHRDLVLLLLHTRNRPRNSIGHHISGVVLGKFHFKLWESFRSDKIYLLSYSNSHEYQDASILTIKKTRTR